MSGQQSGNQTTTQKADPWGPAQAYLTGGHLGASAGMAPSSPWAAAKSSPWSGAKKSPWDLSKNNNSGPIPGLMPTPKVTGVLPEAERLYNEGVANPFNADELSAMEMMRNRVNRDYSLLNMGGDYLGNAAGGDFLNNLGEGGGYLKSVAAGDYLGSSPFMGAYGDDILNTVNSQFSKYNRTGSGQHAGIASKELGNAAGRLYAGERGLQQQAALSLEDIYGRERGFQQQAALSLPGFEASRYGLIDSDIDALLQAGGMQQGRDNENLVNYANIVNAASGQGGTQTSSQPLYRNTGAGILGGAAMGAGLFGAEGALAGLGGISAGGGAGLGALLGLLSDRRAKENIRRVGQTDSGIPVYIYNYIGNPVQHMGVMADEVDHIENAVVNHNGLNYVNYGVIQ
jgi:hypothetical protein